MTGPGRDAMLMLTLALLFVFVQQGVSIKCWVCRSESDPKCGDPFDNRTIGYNDCNEVQPLAHLPGVGKPTMCRKIRQKVNGVWKYFRSCAFLGEPGIEGDERFCLMRTGSYNIFTEYCTCNSKDGCNGATDIRGSWMVYAVAGFTTLGYVLNFSQR